VELRRGGVVVRLVWSGSVVYEILMQVSSCSIDNVNDIQHDRVMMLVCHGVLDEVGYACNVDGDCAGNDALRPPSHAD